MMSQLKLCLSLMVIAAVSLRAETAPILTGWDRVSVTPMKTSIYVGTVTLVSGVFVREGSTLATAYDAKVFPWFFWGEHGTITITLTDAGLANLAKGEKAEFTGDATSHKNKPRKVTGYALPADATSGKIKVRILADGYELIFNGTYRFGGK
jgi:hypothetical protein